MNSRVSVRMCALAAALAAGACKEDPTADLAGKPQTVFINPGTIFLNEGDSINVILKVLDQAGTPLQGAVQATSTAPTVASVTPAAGILPDPTHTTSVYNVKALVPGAADLMATGQGLTDSARINVMPLAFTGTISNTAPVGGTPIIIKATSQFKFTPATTVAFGGGALGLISTFSTESLVVITPFSSPGSLTISDISVSYVQGKTITLPTSVSVTQTGDVWGTGDTSYATAPALTIPAVNDSVHMVTDLKPGTGDKATNCAEWGADGPPNFSVGPCVIYKFTVPGPDSLNLLFRVDWPDDATDVDVYVCHGTLPIDPAAPGICFESGGTGASGRKPEYLRMPLVNNVRTPTAFKYPPGTHWFVIELFDVPVPDNIYVTIYRKP